MAFAENERIVRRYLCVRFHSLSHINATDALDVTVSWRNVATHSALGTRNSRKTPISTIKDYKLNANRGNAHIRMRFVHKLLLLFYYSTKSYFSRLRRLSQWHAGAHDLCLWFWFWFYSNDLWRWHDKITWNSVWWNRLRTCTSDYPNRSPNHCTTKTETHLHEVKQHVFIWKAYQMEKFNSQFKQ